MLPWKRSKFVLVEQESKSKAKSPGGGSSYTSLLSSFLRLCPDLWPERPLDRLGNMFKSKRQKLELTREDPTYSVRYLGSAVTLTAKGLGCTDQAVAKIWDRCEQGTAGARMKLTLGPQGIRMTPAEHRSGQGGHLYLLHRITCSAADAHRPQVFAWIYRHQVRNKAVVLRCHAALVSRADKARAMALLLGQTSSSAFNEFRRLKRQDDARHRQQQRLGQLSVPFTPIRRLLNGQCPYRPPAQRGKSAPRLSSIAEDVRGEEEEEEEEEVGEVGEEEEGEEGGGREGPRLLTLAANAYQQPPRA
ncbi:protein FAM43B [Carcharodon carcharias]|uniref:protein FAM43B n=1 Tax=Carcharodon carcharias TaxID=13397 RepID=UPI001B7F6E83|nr:protein FAM43B [Carcharodon carcharias]